MKKRNGALDLWKFIFSIVIVLLHSRNLATTEQTLFPSGYLCVEFFFIVSGLLMAVGVDKMNRNGSELSLGAESFHFMKKKIFGLMPNYYVAWVIAFIVEHYGKYRPMVMLKDLSNSVWELLLISETGARGHYSNHVCWYISAMLFGMLLFYPIMRKAKDVWFSTIAPALFIFLMGVTYEYTDNLAGPHGILGGLFYKGMLRALMCLALGTICYKIATRLMSVKYSPKARKLWSALELLCFGLALLKMFCTPGNKWDWAVIMLFGVGVTLVYAQVGILTDYCSSPVLNWLGTFSFSLYLGHGYWSHVMIKIFPNLTYWTRLPIYLVLAVLTGLFIHYVSIGIRNWWGKNRDKIRKSMILTEDSSL